MDLYKVSSQKNSSIKKISKKKKIINDIMNLFIKENNKKKIISSPEMGKYVISQTACI